MVITSISKVGNTKNFSYVFMESISFVSGSETKVVTLF